MDTVVVSEPVSVQTAQTQSPAPQTPALWERQPGESDRAFHGFTVYRDLPPAKRTVKSVQDILYPQAPWAERTISGWSHKFKWLARAVAWDNELDRVKREVQLKTVAAMEERHVHQAIALQQKGLEALESLQAGEIDAANARLLIVEGAKLERLARGKSTEKVDDDKSAKLPGSLAGLSESQIRGLADLAQKLEEGAGETKPD